MWPFKKYRLEVKRDFGIQRYMFHVWRGTSIIDSAYGISSIKEATEEGIIRIENLRAADKLKKKAKV